MIHTIILFLSSLFAPHHKPAPLQIQPAVTFRVLNYAMHCSDLLDAAEKKRPDLTTSQINPARKDVIAILSADSSTNVEELVDDLHSRMMFILDQEDYTTI